MNKAKGDKLIKSVSSVAQRTDCINKAFVSLTEMQMFHI